MSPVDIGNLARYRDERGEGERVGGDDPVETSTELIYSC
jgi:hypothetical protein